MKKHILFALLQVILLTGVASAQNGENCSDEDIAPTADLPCCEGLEQNTITGKCADIAYANPNNKICSSNSECGGGQGCFDQTPSSVFQIISDGDENTQSMKEDLIGQIQGLETDGISIKALGQSCTHPKECSSYSCEKDSSNSYVCTQKKICRFAQPGDTGVTGNMKCIPSYEPKNGTCVLSDAARMSIFHDDSIRINEVAGMMCQSEVNPDDKNTALMAMKSLRAMEYLTQNLSQNYDKKLDCLLIFQYLKDKVGIPLATKRRELMTKFNADLAQLDVDYRTLSTANPDSSEQVTFLGKQISQRQLALDQAAGRSGVSLLQKKLSIYAEYEKGMADFLPSIMIAMSTLDDNLSKWVDNDSTWIIDNKSESAFRCRATKEQYRIRYGGDNYRIHDFNTVENRYATWVDVVDPTNDFVNREKAVDAFEHFLGDRTSHVLPLAKNKKYNLMDHFYSLSGEVFVKYQRTGKIINGRRKWRRNSDYYTLSKYDREAFKTNLLEYWKNNYQQDPSNPMSDYVYEPELAAVEARDCIGSRTSSTGTQMTTGASKPVCTQAMMNASVKTNQPLNCIPAGIASAASNAPVANANTPVKTCSDSFDPVVDDITDMGLVQVILFGYNKSVSYSNYFNNNATWRRKLINKWMSDIDLLQKYYQASLGIKSIQDGCLASVGQSIDGLSDSSGIGAGDHTAADATQAGGTLGSTNGKITGPGAKGSNRAFNPKQTLGFSNRSMNANNLMDTLGNISSGQSNFGSGAFSLNPVSLAAINAKRAELLKRNEKLASLGVKIPSNAKLITPTQGSGNTGANGHGGSGANSNSPSKTGSYAGGNATLGDEDADKSASSGPTGAQNLGNQNGAGANAAGKGGNGVISIGGASSGGGYNTPPDTTGLSDEQKNIMMENYERNKSEYQRTDEDGLFGIVSKAYVRNLEKVLNKKKKID